MDKDQPVKNFSASTTLAVPPSPFDEYLHVFSAENYVEQSPLRPEMNDNINHKDPNLEVKPSPIKAKEEFLTAPDINLRQQEALVRVHKSYDTPACTMFMIPKIDKPNEARFLHELVARNRNPIIVTGQVRDLARMGIPLLNSDYKTYSYNEI